MNETSLKRAILYLFLAANAVLLSLWLCGCATPAPPTPEQLEFPPVKYGGPPLPPKQTGWNWNLGETTPPISVRVEWDYGTNDLSNIVFRIYRSSAPVWQTNWVGWQYCGETTTFAWSEVVDTIPRGFYTVTASNTLTGLESDPARKE